MSDTEIDRAWHDLEVAATWDEVRGILAREQAILLSDRAIEHLTRDITTFASQSSIHGRDFQVTLQTRLLALLNDARARGIEAASQSFLEQMRTEPTRAEASDTMEQLTTTAFADEDARKHFMAQQERILLSDACLYYLFNFKLAWDRLRLSSSDPLRFAKYNYYFYLFMYARRHSLADAIRISDDTQAALNAFTHAPHWSDAQAVLEREKALLLTDLAVALLTVERVGWALDPAQVAEGNHLARGLMCCLTLLDMSRIHDIPTAFRLLSRGQLPGVPKGMPTIYELIHGKR